LLLTEGGINSRKYLKWSMAYATSSDNQLIPSLKQLENFNLHYKLDAIAPELDFEP
jgi:hypothetical protein